MENSFKNYNQIAVTPERKSILAIAEEGLRAIDTKSAIDSNISLTGNTLKIKDHSFDLSKFASIKVIGFGKASCRAAYALEQFLGSRINSGIALGIAPVACEYIKTYQGTHPHPSYGNVELTESVLEVCKNPKEQDLVIVIVSGGGSALLCWPKEECDQGQMLYHQFLKTGGDIRELNTIRKHISLLKGGGLAKYLYPATVIGLIFSDVPGDNYDMVASGPTYPDQTTIADAKQIIGKYGLMEFNLTETPKETKYFEKVTNIPMVSNGLALQAMAEKAESLGFTTEVVSSELYDEAAIVLNKLKQSSAQLVLAGGEPKVRITSDSDSRGGRNLRASLVALTESQEGETFLSLASDGLDNSDAAGAFTDRITADKARQENLNISEHIEKDKTYEFFDIINELIFTGPTESNVSDLLILLKK